MAFHEEPKKKSRRHVPGEAISALGDLSFDRALSEALQPNGEYDVNRWLFVPNRYTEYRYILGTRGRNPLICVGINPSTARPDALDPTLESVQRIALGNGFDSFLMFNVSAQRATDPDHMDETLYLPLHRENLLAFDFLLSLSVTPTVWAAWGTIIEKRPYLPGCVFDLAEIGKRHDARWISFGPRSKSGHPHHPLYLRKDAGPEEFDIYTYLASFSQKRFPGIGRMIDKK